MPLGGPDFLPRLILAPMSPKSTPTAMIAAAKPTRARPSRTRSVIWDSNRILSGEQPRRRLKRLPACSPPGPPVRSAAPEDLSRGDHEGYDHKSHGYESAHHEPIELRGAASLRRRGLDPAIPAQEPRA